MSKQKLKIKKEPTRAQKDAAIASVVEQYKTVAKIKMLGEADFVDNAIRLLPIRSKALEFYKDTAKVDIDFLKERAKKMGEVYKRMAEKVDALTIQDVPVPEYSDTASIPDIDIFTDMLPTNVETDDDLFDAALLFNVVQPFAQDFQREVVYKIAVIQGWKIFDGQ